MKVPDGIKILDDAEAGIVSVAQPKKGPGGAEEGEEGEEAAETAEAPPATDAKAEGAAEAPDKKK